MKHYIKQTTTNQLSLNCRNTSYNSAQLRRNFDVKIPELTSNISV